MNTVLRPCCCLLLALLLPAHTPAQRSATDVELSTALAGRWTGFLEYRDYSEPADSIKRVTLPTWLSVTATEGVEAWHYVYDDGPGKVVDEDEQIAFDPEHSRATITPAGKAQQSFQVTGFAALKAGRGTLLLSGTGTDSGKPSERRLTLTVGRNMVVLLEEVRPAGTQDPFAYRHQYRFVREMPPAVTAPR